MVLHQSASPSRAHPRVLTTGGTAQTAAAAPSNRDTNDHPDRKEHDGHDQRKGRQAVRLAATDPRLVLRGGGAADLGERRRLRTGSPDHGGARGVHLRQLDVVRPLLAVQVPRRVARLARHGVVGRKKKIVSFVR